MDFMNRGGNQPAPHNNRPEAAASVSSRGAQTNGKNKIWRVASFVLLLLITGLIVAVLLAISTGNNNNADNESKLVNSSQMQAVFLTNGQVYFGNIKQINGKYIDLSNIYYLTTNQQVQPNTSTANTANSNVQLVKLGCELHAPVDQMTINRDQITFWENLKTDGQFAKAVAQYKQQNPNGQNCNQASTSTTTTGTDNKQ